jgi:hypothetical protein
MRGNQHMVTYTGRNKVGLLFPLEDYVADHFLGKALAFHGRSKDLEEHKKIDFTLQTNLCLDQLTQLAD